MQGLRIACLLCSCLVFGFGITAISAPPSPEGPTFVSGEILVRYAKSVSDEAMHLIERNEGLSLLHKIPHLRVRHYRLPPGAAVQTICDRLTLHPAVRVAEPNYRHSLLAIPTDPRFSEQWGLHNTGQIVLGQSGPADADIDWPEAMDLYSNNGGVIVAVIDSGVAIDHPDIINNVWVNVDEPVDGIDNDGNGYVDDRLGWDFFDNDALPLDENGHGTLVASQIAAEINNGIGGAGVAPEAQIMVLRILNDFSSGGAGSTANFLLSTTYATQEGAEIINYSAGRTGAFSQIERDQVAWLDTQGVLLVAAAGNGGADGVGDDNDVTPVYPAAYDPPNILAVAASNRSDDLADFSNFGTVTVDLAAPGTDTFGADVNRSTTYLETFETGAPGWTVNQNCVFCDNWSLFLDVGGNVWANDSMSLLTGDPLIYLPFADAWMDSPWLAIPLIGPQLSFRIYVALEAFDVAAVQISTDGLFWDTLDAIQGPFFTLTNPPWLSSTAGVTVSPYDLSPYAGQTAKLRFRIITDGALENDGVYVDDVALSEVTVFFFDGTQFTFNNGTSFAAPLVSGVAALLMSHRPDLTHHQIRDAILNSVDPIASLSGMVATGGQLNAMGAIQYVPEPSLLILQLAESP